MTGVGAPCDYTFGLHANSALKWKRVIGVNGLVAGRSRADQVSEIN